MARFAPNTHALAADQAIARLRRALDGCGAQVCPSLAMDVADDLRIAEEYRGRRAYALATRRAQRGLRAIGLIGAP